MQTGSKEFDLLCACAAVEITPERAARIARATSAELDWNVTSARIIEDEIPPLQRPIRQHSNQSAVGNIRGDQRLGHLHDAEAIESRPQG